MLYFKEKKLSESTLDPRSVHMEVSALTCDLACDFLLAAAGGGGCWGGIATEEEPISFA